MHPTQAMALRRGALAAAGLGSAVAAHGAAAGGPDLLPVAPTLWAGLVSLAMLAGPRRGYAARGPAATVALLLCAQAAFHAVATWAPWAVGLGGHAHPAALAPGSLAAHAAAALVLGVLLVRGSRLLDAAVRVARRLRRPARGRTGPPPQPAPAHATPTPRSAIAGRGAGARAPPAGAVVAA